MPKSIERHLERFDHMNAPFGHDLQLYYATRRTMKPHTDDFGSYAAVESYQSKMAERAGLLESVGEGNHPMPAITVCVPFAERSEDLGSLSTTLRQVAKAQRNFGQPVEVVVWSNTTYGETEEPSGKTNRYQDIPSVLEPYVTDSVAVSIAHADVDVSHSKNPMCCIR